MRTRLIPLILGLATAPAAAQGYHYTSSQNGSITLDRFGVAMAGLGDIDGDGYDDYAVGASTESSGPFVDSGLIHVYSGAHGGELYRVPGPYGQGKYGEAIANVGDIDGDGIDDLLVGAPDGGYLVSPPGPGYADLRSGANGNYIRNHIGSAMKDRFGGAVTGLGDVDNDGVPDYAIGARGYDPGLLQDAGAVFVYSGATGNLLYQVNGTADFAHFGRSLAAVGDITGDGRSEWAAGAPEAPRTGVGGNVGYVQVCNGANGASLWLWQGVRVDDRYGNAVAGLADQNGDGVREIVVGASRASTALSSALGAVFVYSGQTGAQLRRINGPSSGSRFGDWVGSVSDRNGDGKRDLAVGMPANGQVLFHDALTGFLLGSLSAPNGEPAFGAEAAEVGDLDGDGKPEFLVGAPDAEIPTGSGSVHFFRNQDLPEGFHWTRRASNGRWYGILRDVTWAEAAAAADQDPENEVVTVRDIAEHDWLWQTLLGSDGIAYIGLSDAAQEGNFRWRSGASTPWWAANNYFGVGGVPGNWYFQEPNNVNNEDYVTMGRPGAATDGEWNDTNGLTARDALYEWSPQPQVSLGYLGSCPGMVSVGVGGATPNGNVAIVYGPAGQTPAAAGPCGQVMVPLGNPTLLFVAQAGANGALNFSGNVPQSGCGTLRAVAFDLSSCVFSNTISF